MGNEAPTDAQKNTVQEVELAVLAAEDSETGQTIPVLADEGVLQADIRTSDGEALTDALKSIGGDEVLVQLETDNLGSNLDIDLAEQTLSQLDVDLSQVGGQAQSAADVANLIDQIQDALVSAGGDELRIATPSPIDASAAEVDVDLNSQSLSPLVVTDDGSLAISSLPEPLDVSDAEVDVDIQSQTLGTLTVTDDGSFQIVDSTDTVIEEPLDVSDAVVTVTDDGALAIASLPEPIDVSGAEVDVDLNTQSLAALTVTDDGALVVDDYTGSTLPTEQQTPVGVEDSGGTQVDPLAQRDLPVGTDTFEGAQQSLAADREYLASYRATGVSDTNTAFQAVIDNPLGSGVTGFVAVEIITGGLAYLNFSEDITKDTTGPTIGTVPKDIMSGTSPSLNVEQGGSYTINGTTLESILPGSDRSGGPAASQGASEVISGALRLEEEDSVLYEVVNQSGGAADFAINVEIVEV